MRQPRPDPVLIKALRTAHVMLKREAGEPMIDATPASPYHRRLLRLAFLAPELQRAILAGRQPAGLTLKQLLEQRLPLLWTDQVGGVRPDHFRLTATSADLRRSLFRTFAFLVPRNPSPCSAQESACLFRRITGKWLSQNRNHLITREENHSPGLSRAPTALFWVRTAKIPCYRRNSTSHRPAGNSGEGRA